MGLYINIGNEGFRAARNGEYVDKSALIELVNNSLNSECQFMCVSRARRFGKSMAAKMLNAYYDHSCQSKELFDDLVIAKSSSYKIHLNKYPVLYVDMTNFITRYRNSGNMVYHIQSDILAELKEAYPTVQYGTNDDLLSALYAIVQQAEPDKFIMIVDEWDAILRESNSEHDEGEKYVDFLRLLFKSGNSLSVFAGVYMTGILPIKKYKTQSALNNFEEYTMISPGEMAACFGFTDEEVSDLCNRNKIDKEQIKMWYDGYRIGDQKSIYNPLSVIRAIKRQYCESYWSNTGTYETVSHYIKMNYEGLKDDVIKLLAGKSCNVNTKNFQNDVNVVNSKNDVFTVLIHLGYLSYNRDTNECYIPNKEIGLEFENAVEDTGWAVVSDALKQSEQLLQWTLNDENERVAHAIDRIHSDNTSILQYNDENSLACVLALAYYSAKNKYGIVRELPTGKGFADLVLVPRRNVDLPAIVLELKYNHNAETAIDQIKDKHYTDSLLDYVGEVILVGINYNKRTKKHRCKIEGITKVSPAADENIPSFDEKASPDQEKNVPSIDIIAVVVNQCFPDTTARRKSKLTTIISELLKTDLSTSEMMLLLEEQNRTRLRKDIIYLLQERDWITKTDLDNLTTPNQKYKLTETAWQQIKQYNFETKQWEKR